MFGEHLAVLAAAMILDVAVGDPAWLWRRLPHPVSLVGRLVSGFDRAFNRTGRRPWLLKALGAMTVTLLLIAALAVGALIELALAAIPYGWVATAIVISVLLTGRDLWNRARAIAKAFETGGLDAARAAFALLPGDSAGLDEARLCRATIEKVACGFADGLVAPVFWFALFGLPGLLACKAVNVADAAVGHLSLRHRDFGWATARLDDFFNLPAGRIAGHLITLAAPLAGGSVAGARAVMRRDAPRHRSANAGWPEAAMASALGVTLGGPRRYSGILVDDVYLNAAGRREAIPGDIRRALKVYVGAGVILLAIVALATGAFLLAGKADFRWLLPGWARA
ncbi:MAG: CobD/CbiB family cobalamin biosynthesis protein [Bauldia sp.]